MQMHIWKTQVKWIENLKIKIHHSVYIKTFLSTSTIWFWISLLLFCRIRSLSKHFCSKNIQDPIFRDNIKPCLTFHNKRKSFFSPKDESVVLTCKHWCKEKSIITPLNGSMGSHFTPVDNWLSLQPKGLWIWGSVWKSDV